MGAHQDWALQWRSGEGGQCGLQLGHRTRQAHPSTGLRSHGAQGGAPRNPGHWQEAQGPSKVRLSSFGTYTEQYVYVAVFSGQHQPAESLMGLDGAVMWRPSSCER